MRKTSLSIFVLLLGSLAAAQQPTSQADMPGMDMSHDGSHAANSDMHDMPGMNSEGSASAMHAMEGHMDMGPHMKMTALRAPQPGDKEKADAVAEAARKVAAKYQDYKLALADGFKIFHPEIPQKQYHFTNFWYALEAARKFNPDHPTSLLYEKQGDGYKLVGVMYTDRKTASDNDLNARIPLSIARWHAHVNFCLPPADKRAQMMGPHPQFGLRGSIVTKDACDAADGKFLPQIFGWMVHVYPMEKNPADVWSVEKQHMD